VYHPFRIVSENNGREVVYNPLILTEKGYEMDLEHLESIIDDRCRMLILSNPHNPGGTAWSAETLRKLADICAAHGIVVISDEIHSDMYLFGNRHIPFATVSEKAAEISITFAAPSKTFNIAGVVASYCVVPDDSLRERFFGWMKANEMNATGIFPPIATAAAYRNGDEWLSQMLEYVQDNVLYVEDFCRQYIPGVRALRPDASFLVWLDCRGLGLSHDRLVSLFVDDAGLALNDGEMFGPGGEGFMRLNVGTSRSVLAEAMERLAAAVAAL
jgi:cystathionine beta-lyase